MESNISGYLGCYYSRTASKAQRRKHSRRYVTGVVRKHDCMDAGETGITVSVTVINHRADCRDQSFCS